MATYSFLEVYSTITGPGGSVNLASGAQSADEGITIDFAEQNNMTIGADGAPMHTLIANKSATITVRLLKTSPNNQALMGMMTMQTAGASNHGQNVMAIVNKSSGDSTTAQQVAFKKRPTITYDKDGAMMEWTFDAGIVDTALGEY